MATSPKAKIRRMTIGDLLALDQIDPNFTSTGYLDIETERNDGGVAFRFNERTFDTPFVKTQGYRYDADQLEMTRYRLESRKNNLMLVAEAEGVRAGGQVDRVRMRQQPGVAAVVAVAGADAVGIAAADGASVADGAALFAAVAVSTGMVTDGVEGGTVAPPPNMPVRNA